MWRNQKVESFLGKLKELRKPQWVSPFLTWLPVLWMSKYCSLHMHISRQQVCTLQGQQYRAGGPKYVHGFRVRWSFTIIKSEITYIFPFLMLFYSVNIWVGAYWKHNWIMTGENRQSWGMEVFRAYYRLQNWERRR